MILINISEWTWIPKYQARNQAIFMQLMRTGRFSRGLFVNSPEVLPVRRRMATGLPRLEALSFPDAGPCVRVLAPLYTLPFTFRAPVLNLSVAHMRRQLEQCFLRGEAYVLWLNNLSLLQVALSAELAPGAAQRVFDCSDDFTQFNIDRGTRQDILDNLGKVIKIADDVVAVNQHVADTLGHPRKHVFLNCTDFENFQRSPADYKNPPLFPKAEGAAYVGFSGGLHGGRVDFPLLEQLFMRFPEVCFLFVGNQNGGAREFVMRFPNTRLIDPVPYDILPAIIRSFNVAIIPHLDNAYTRGNDLLKILDYFASGVPVVTTRCSGVERYREACYIADDPEIFLNHVAALLSGRPHDPEPGYAFAAQRTWSSQVPRLAEELFSGLDGAH